MAILLVDDDAKNLTALESILEPSGHELTKVQSAEDALLALMRQDFAAIVLDVEMPGISGIELARIIKKRKKTQNIPILFLTAHYRESEEMILGYDVGAVDYLTKPVHPAVLRSKVSVFADLFRKTRALGEANRNMEAEILERKVAEERFRVVVEAAPSAMFVFQEGGAIELVNSAAESLFGAPREELTQRRITQLLDGLVLPDFASGKVGSERYESVIRGPMGTETPVEARFASIHSSDGPRWMAWIIDVTERKLREEALRTANAELEAKNAALQKQHEERMLRAQAQSAQTKAEAANAAKDRFLAMLSHELRTPLSPVLHSVALLNEHPGCPPDMREILQIIGRNVQLEARLIDDLLDLARIHNGKLQLELQSTDAHELLNNVLEICGPSFLAHNLQVKVRLEAVNARLKADPARIQQIFWNLLNNAVKYSSDGGEISVATKSLDATGALQVQVVDHGIGIPEENLRRIFDAFEQGAAFTSSKGLGLGLAISKALTEFHGGTISADSAGLGAGATFTVTLPAAHALDAPAPPATPAPLSNNKLKVLLVEDHADTAATLSTLLLRKGYEVHCAASRQSAIKAAQSFPFDVLVTDLGLPDGSGVDLLDSLKDAIGDRKVRGVVLSGFGMEEDVTRSREAGFSHHLTKPVDFAVLHRCLMEIGRELEHV